MRSLSAIPPTSVTRAKETETSNTVGELSRDAPVPAVFLDITRTFGISFVPDLFERMRARPAYLEAAWELFTEDLGLDSLNCKTRHIMALAITTNEAGVYSIAAYPHAFRLHAIDHDTCDKLLLTIRFFNVFDRYLSGITPASVREPARFVSDCLREEYQSYKATRSSQLMLSREENQPAVSWIGGGLIMNALLWPIAVGVYLFLR